MKFQWNGWGNVINRMLHTIYNQQDVVRRSCILVSLMLSSCSLEYEMKRYLVDVNGYQGISPFWDYTHYRETWSIMSSSMFTCFPKELEKENCTVLSSSYNVRKAN